MTRQNYSSELDKRSNNLTLKQAYITNKKVTDRLTKPTTASINHRAMKSSKIIPIPSHKVLVTDRTSNMNDSRPQTSTSTSSFVTFLRPKS